MDMNELLKLIKAGESESVEFKRSAGKTIHKDIVAFANAEGGNILIGVDDDGSIVGTDTKNAMDRITNSIQSIVPLPEIMTHRFAIGGEEVVVIEVEKSDVLCSVGGIAHIRIGAGTRPLSIQEVLVLASEMGTMEWDGAPLLPIDEAEEEYLDWFFEKLEESRGKNIGNRDRTRYLRSAGALKGDRLTNAGVLFFTKATAHLQQSRLRLVYMEDGAPAGSKEYEGTVWKMIEDAYADVLRETGSREVVVSARRRKDEGYPSRALREAMINAVAHRNYAIQADIRVFIHPDRIIVRSPGGILPGVDLTDPEHVPRNPSLCNLLYDTGFIERYGYGIRMMKEEVDRYPGLTLGFDVKSSTFKVTLKKDLNALLDETDLKILETIAEPMKSSDISEIIGTAKPTTLRRLKKLEKRGLIKKMGVGPQTKYVSR
jgi:ATP-dependent DNA helicase RecG